MNNFNKEERTKQIKLYLTRLSDGENLESVRADFKREFEHVDAAEIMMAEQQLLKDGTPLSEVQRLCDVHSALFHGATKEEQIANAERAASSSIREYRMTKTRELIEKPGHPLNIFARENEELSKIVKVCQKEIENNNVTDNSFNKLRDVSIHYAKKGDLLYPQLNVKYGISGPSAVMWTVDDEIRDELNALARKDRDKSWIQRFKVVLNRIDEMIYKEENILFPNLAVNFTDEEWKGIYRDMLDYKECFGISQTEYYDVDSIEYKNMVQANYKDAVANKAATNEAVTNKTLSNGAEANKDVCDKRISNKDIDVKDDIILGGGHMTVEQIDAMLNTIPLEISFVDSDNINRYFNEGSKVFKRPVMAIDRSVFSCHPPKVEQKVRRIIDEFRNGTLDKVPVWMEKEGRTMLVTYMAVRDKENNYVGTLELVQDMEFAKEHFVR